MLGMPLSTSQPVCATIETRAQPPHPDALPMSLDQPLKTYADRITPVTLSLPPLACDTHVHIFGPGARFPYAATRTFTPVDAPKETLFDLHRRLGIGRCVIVQSMVHGPDNSVVVDAIQAEFDIPAEQVYLYRDIANTSSPGKLFPAVEFRRALARSR